MYIYIVSSGGETYSPMQLNALPTEFESDNFVGRCMLLHRPSWSYEGEDLAHYPYKQHFNGRKRLWEWRIQGRFKRRPESPLYCGVELEKYVPVNFGTRRALSFLCWAKTC